MQSTQMSIIDSPDFYTSLEGDWPVLEQANDIPTWVTTAIREASNSNAITQYLSYYSLGFFYVHTSLLEPHASQRPIDTQHVDKLLKSYQELGIFRTEHPGVLIGTGDGWYSMRNASPLPVMLSPSFPHLNHLSHIQNGPIAQIIRGHHRTVAMNRFATNTDGSQSDESYWYYNILVPSMYFFSFE